MPACINIVIYLILCATVKKQFMHDMGGNSSHEHLADSLHNDSTKTDVAL